MLVMLFMFVSHKYKVINNQKLKIEIHMCEISSIGW